jgi:hypothetical protein
MSISEKAEGIKCLGAMKSEYNGAIYTEEKERVRKRSDIDIQKEKDEYYGSGLQFSSERYHQPSNCVRSLYRLS